MDNNREERRQIFRNELYTLKRQGYLEQEEVDHLIAVHNQYSRDLITKEDEARALAAQSITEKPIVATTQVKKQKSTKKRKITNEEIRERNISWLLNLGVILLLIGGLFVATSNWATMSDLMKAASIGLVSLLFYGIAFIALKLLKIEKTAVAFIVLGSLFIPIFILSLGWFQLLGEFLSFEGEGKFLLGVIGSILIFPIYATIAQRLTSRLFVWFSLITLTAGAAFFLRAVGWGIDAFYLGMILYNSGLVIGIQMMKKRGTQPLFTKELAPFAQVNLVLSTLLLLFFYENQVFYGFNLILTACIYLAMIYVSGKKQYHFVFSVMLVYATYQIFESWVFDAFSPMGFAFVGIVFLLVPRFIIKEFGLEKAFRSTSAIVSILAFLYISVEGMLLRADEPSIILLLAYLMIAANFLYLANTESTRLFRYLSPVFLASALFEGVRILDQWLDFPIYTLPIFFIGYILFLIGWIIGHKWLQVIKQSLRDVGFIIMSLVIWVGFLLAQWWELGLMLLLLATVLFVMVKIDGRKPSLLITPWLFPIVIGISIVCFGEEFYSHSSFYSEDLGRPFHFASAGLLTLVTSWVLLKLKIRDLSTSSFLTGEVFYALALLYSLILPMDHMIVRPSLWFVGIFLFYIMYQFTDYKWMRSVVAGSSLAFYFIIQIPLHEQIKFTSTMDSFVLGLGGMLLLLISIWLKRRDGELASAFAWVGQIYLVPALLLTYFAFGAASTWPLLIGVVIYVISIRFAHVEWSIKLFLYGAFTTLFLAMDAGLRLFVGEALSHYAFLLTSITLGVYYTLANKLFKKRAFYYLVPFSLLGLIDLLSVYPVTGTLYLVLTGYAVGLLVLLHYGNWGNLVILPLLLFLFGTLEFIRTAEYSALVNVFLLAVIGVGLLATGCMLYKRLWEPREKLPVVKVDGYTIAAFLFFASIYLFRSETFWAGIVHGVLVSVALWIQRLRVPSEIRFGLTFLAGAYLLLPYYTILNELELHPLWQQEAILLPWVLLMIYLKVTLRGKWSRLINYIQWAVLLLVSLLLVADGLASSTIYDALILGSLSLVSLLAGMWLRIKAYFFVGSGVLLLNVLLQTKPYWGNLPWWGYLLIVGTLLITIASFNEWNKQKVTRGEKTFLIKIIETIRKKLKQWD